MLCLSESSGCRVFNIPKPLLGYNRKVSKEEIAIINTGHNESMNHCWSGMAKDRRELLVRIETD